MKTCKIMALVEVSGVTTTTTWAQKKSDAYTEIKCIFFSLLRVARIKNEFITAMKQYGQKDSIVDFDGIKIIRIIDTPNSKGVKS